MSLWLVALLPFVSSQLFAQTGESKAAVLREQFNVASQRSRDKSFPEPIFLDSSETSDRLTGQVYARLDHPFSSIKDALTGPSQWCSILILHMNVKYCRASSTRDAFLDVAIGRKFDQPLSSAFWTRFKFQAAAGSEDYLQIELEAPTGPMSTREYRIAIEAAPLDAERSVLHLIYSYSYGFTARLAMRSYLATLGRNKVGFSIVGQEPSGRPKLVDGVLGLVERNTMRYYLAVDAFVAAYKAPVSERLQKSLENWYSATERYPLQLHEMDRRDYLEMKLHETQRQQTELPPPS